MKKHIAHISLFITIAVMSVGLFGCNKQQIAIEPEPTEAVMEPTGDIATLESTLPATTTQEIRCT